MIIEEKNNYSFLNFIGVVVVMSKVGNALKMLIILQSRGKMKVCDLARELEVDERQIRRYKDDLLQAGIYIKSETGKYGGYSIEDNNYLLGLNLTNEEYMSLLMANEELKKMGHLALKDYSLAIDKINIVHKRENLNLLGNCNYMVKSARANVNFEVERKKLVDIHAAMLTRNKVRIKYTSLTSGETERVVRPYATFQYKGDMYFIGFCERKNGILEFKLCRIKEYSILEEKFEMDNSFSLEDYMANCFGIFKDEEINVKLKIYHPMSQIVKEKIWVDNQKIIENEEDNSIIFEATMKGLKEIKSWILSMGSSVKVLKPQKLIEEIKNEIDKIKELY
ncbi:Predicted DNA-binding transcriptional regulator YafY, contains an HTH and WYL domains [Caminicella sporogenes DSM 14501]|uniref:Predicted DNA-binding transcriptional regulator YafY, contains an HTH and WYL domains n=1 Tax=Caminicella sporogenes DSM 14501 TaxID=1121266 RepID=A0A1M6TNK2_9FIRM|nr:WYL domain-containing transcriptional regulator [Caminicella sporogenes]SHK58531.1 Predicted DNA-binding transcriptional regulator YafY, contains an HTH and WYL domains [Caminicella sporogenes DSM 14501]